MKDVVNIYYYGFAYMNKLGSGSIAAAVQATTKALHLCAKQCHSMVLYFLALLGLALYNVACRGKLRYFVCNAVESGRLLVQGIHAATIFADFHGDSAE